MKSRTMLNIRQIWRSISTTRALQLASGQCEKDFFETYYRILYLAGLSSVETGYKYMIYRFFVNLSIVCLVICAVWHLVSDSPDLNVAVENFNVTIMNCIAFYRYQSMQLANKPFFRKLASAMENENFDISTEERKYLLKFWATRNHNYLKSLLSLGAVTLFLWFVYPLVDDVDYNIGVIVRIPFDYANDVAYPITYFAVMMIFNYCALFVMTNDLLLQVYLMQILCQFAVLSDCFENILRDCGIEFGSQEITPEKDKEWREKYAMRLRGLVKQHAFILNNTMELKQILKFPLLAQFVASSMLICFVAYQTTQSLHENVTKLCMSIFYLGYNVFQLYVFCRWCHEIQIQSEQIADAVYNSGWEGEVSQWPEIISRLLIVVSRARKPLMLTAGGIYDLSLVSYGTLLKTSYSALTVMLQVKD